MLFYIFLVTFFLYQCHAAANSHQVNTNTTIPTVNIKVDTQTRFQVIDGFGISEAFQRARHIQRLTSEDQQKTLDLLFSRTNGASLTVLRNGIGSSINYDRDFMKSIAPVSPVSPNAIPKYEWDGDDAGQVWITKEAIKRAGDDLTVYADAWSAPAYMKSNGNDSNGGWICGVHGTNCSTGDWKQAFANYLLQFLKFYKEKEGISITHLGFLNEPDLNQTYASMQSSGFQAADFLKVLRPTLQESEFCDVKIVCCEATGWGDAEDLLAELQTIPGAEESFDVYSAHGYSVHPSLPFNTPAKVWQTEWADLSGKWNPAWDKLGKEGEGIAWANKIHSALMLSNVSAFVYWIGAANTTNNDALINLRNGGVEASKRLWAHAQFSRFVRPGARRVDAKSDVGFVRVSAFENIDGRIAVQVLNNGHVNVDAQFEIWGVQGMRESASLWLTNEEADLIKGEDVLAKGGDFDRIVLNASVPMRSMMTFVL